MLSAFIVNSNADPGTGVGNNGSLRYVINQLDQSTTPTNSIDFDIGTGLQTITLNAELPAITKPVTIDGYTEPGASANTAAVGTKRGDQGSDLCAQRRSERLSATGFRCWFAGERRPRAVNLRREDNGTKWRRCHGIDLDASDVTVLGNFIGIQANGESAGANREGIIVENSTADAIGGPAPADRNLISGNTDSGILVVTDTSAANNLLVQGNLIGTDKTGSVGIPNDYGIEMIGASTSDNTIGGTAAGAGNVISGNVFYDVEVFGGASNNTIEGNLIGLTADGSSTVNVAPGQISTGGIDLDVDSTNNVIGGAAAGAGNVIGGTGSGIVITGSGTTGNVVLGNLIGTNTSGVDLGNGVGVSISTSTGTSNTIGGTAAGAGNVISANFSAGVSLSGASGVVIEGNIIGLAPNGSTILGQGGDGITLAAGSSSNTIGGTKAGAGNIVSGNSGYGIDLVASAGDSGNLIAGNIVGLESSNSVAANVEGGMFISGTSNTVGGTVSAARNVISGNEHAGLVVDTGTLVVGNYIGIEANGNPLPASDQGEGVFILGSNNTVGGTTIAVRNIISGNIVAGINLSLTASGNLIEGNFVGTDSAGTVALPNEDGVAVTGSKNTIGGTAPGAGNVISGNSGDGILISGQPGSVGDGTGNVVLGNLIGTNASGGLLGQGGDGITLETLSSDNTIGGTTAGAGNIVSGNSGYGIDLAAGAGDTGNLIAGNIVGLNASNNVVANVAGGMFIVGTGNTVGGTVSAARNVISGNESAGLVVDTGTLVVGNYIGTDSSGNALAASPQLTGISVTGSSNTIGGTTAAARNVISGNATQGIDLSLTASGNLIEGNYVGTNAAGTLAVPDGDGVDISGSKNTIGGTTAGAGNTIADNTGTGVVVDEETGNAVLSNSIFNNTVGGIELVNGGNNNQLSPVLTAAQLTPMNELEVDGLLAVDAGTSYLVQFFGNNPASDQGQTLLGSLTISAQSSAGTVTLNFVTTATLPTGATVTAIASVAMAPTGSLDPATGDTSPFSGVATVMAAAPDPFIVTNTLDSPTNPQIGSLRFAILAVNADVGHSPTISFDIVGNGIQTITLNADLPAITNPVTIDGYTEPGASPNTAAVGTNAVIMVQIFVPNGGVSDAALVFDAGSQGSVVRGLSIFGADNGTNGGDAGIDLDASDVTVLGNFIGIQANGESAGANREGITVENSTGDVIGGSAPADRNLISGNTNSGILVATDTSAVNKLLVQGNLIGTDKAGTVGIPNLNGIEMIGASTSGNTIGGTATGDGNVISANLSAGLSLSSASGVVIEGNIIGLGPNGSTVLGQGGDGITLAAGSSGNKIGGTIAGAGNIVSGNSGFGIDLVAGAGDTGNLIAGNIVGLGSSNSVAANLEGGIFISGTSNTVGGIVSAARNVISGNESAGLVVDTGTLVVGNYIGTSSSGNAVAASPQLTGISVTGSSNTIGGTTAAARNVISGNATQGINIAGSMNLIEGNYVGTNAAGTLAVPDGDGVDINLSTNTIGGTTAGAGNTIADNTGNGVVVDEGTGNAVLSNSIHDNKVGGIELLNGGNHNQLAPVLTDAKTALNQLEVVGSLAVDAGTSYLVQYFSNNPASDQGQTLLGSQMISAKASAGTVPLAFSTTATLPAGATVTAIASVAMAPMGSLNPATGDTSRFSGAFAVVAVDPFIVTNTTDSATNPLIGSLRFAILAVNADVGHSPTISFDIGTGLQTITLNADLPAITNPVTIDGYTEPGASANTAAVGTNAVIRVQIFVPNGGVSDAALVFDAGSQGSVVRGLSIIGADNGTNGGDAGIDLDVSDVTVVGNFIGVQANGESAGPNRAGIIVENSTGDVIGGPAPADRNIISGNTDSGILVVTDTSAANNLLVQGNLIGTDKTGSVGIPNDYGIEMIGASTSDNTIGGTAAGDGNVISGNVFYDVEVFGGASNNTIEGNLIGLTADGSSTVNVAPGQISTGGIDLDVGSTNNVIGGAAAGARNVIGGTGSGIVITGSGATGNVVLGNLIGTNTSGNDLGNDVGVSISTSTATSNTIGGTAAGAGNVISGNFSAGVSLSGASGVVIEGNIIGLAPNGSTILGQGGDGITLAAGSSSNTIGGTKAGAGNIVSGNSGYGIDLVASAGDSGNLIAGNIVGLESSNSVAANVEGGMFISGTSNTVGGTVSAARNVISGNEHAGLVVDTGTLVVGNYIGTGSSGNAVGASPQSTGISVTGSGNTIGGTTAAARNVISGNATQGINIAGSMNLIEGNYVGTNAAGTVAVPDGDGVDISGSKNTIGGTTAGAANTIADNTGNGVVVDEGTGNAVLSNSIHDNTGGGIELLNSGNNNQPAPVLTDAKTALNEMEVDGSLAVDAGTSYLVQYFGNNPASDQGQTLLGSQMISAQSSAGTVPLTFFTAATLPAGATVTAIASVAMAPNGSFNPAPGDTSRFSSAV